MSGVSPATDPVWIMSLHLSSVRVTAHRQKVGSNMSCALFCDDSEEESG